MPRSSAPPWQPPTAEPPFWFPLPAGSQSHRQGGCTSASCPPAAARRSHFFVFHTTPPAAVRQSAPRILILHKPVPDGTPAPALRWQTAPPPASGKAAIWCFFPLSFPDSSDSYLNGCTNEVLSTLCRMFHIVCPAIEIGAVLADADPAMLGQFQHRQKQCHPCRTLPHIGVQCPEIHVFIVIHLSHHVDHLGHHRHHRTRHYTL